MRSALLLSAILILPALPAPASGQALACSDTASCIQECQSTLGKSRSECRRLVTRMQANTLQQPAPSVPVQPPSRSKYKPVPQGNGGSQDGGLYRNPE